MCIELLTSPPLLHFQRQELIETDTTPKRGADESVAKYQLVYFTSLFQLVYYLIISNQEPFPSLFFSTILMLQKNNINKQETKTF